MSGFLSFLRLHSIPLCVYTPFCLSIHWSIDIWVASTSWLLWIMLHRTWVCWSLLRFYFDVFSVYPQKWDCWIILLILFLNFWGISLTFSMMALPFYFSTSSAEFKVSNYWLFWNFNLFTWTVRKTSLNLIYPLAPAFPLLVSLAVLSRMGVR